MEQIPDNPEANKIGPGISEDQIKNAIEKSGYPLQTIVGDFLRNNPVAEKERFSVQEEWSFLDSDTEGLRSIDLLAELQLFDNKLEPRVRPHLNLLIECKQSQLPYIFFEAISTPTLLSFPSIAGLPQDKISIATDDSRSTWIYSVQHALDLFRQSLPLKPRHCYTLSKCARKGSEIELSGSDAYNNLVQPLVKALQHFVRLQKPVSTAWYFDCHAVFAVGVLDAPMISVSVNSSGPVITTTPWVRVLRHEYAKEAESFEHEQLRIIDVVHKDFLHAYLGQYLVPTSKRFAEGVLRHPNELATGLAFAPNMDSNWAEPIETRMRPRPLTSRFTKQLSQKLIKLLSRK